MNVTLNRPEKHICKTCGKEFVTSSKYRYTCSRECTQRAKVEKIRKKERS